MYLIEEDGAVTLALPFKIVHVCSQLRSDVSTVCFFQSSLGRDNDDVSTKYDSKVLESICLEPWNITMGKM